MSAHNLSRLSKFSPEPHTVFHGEKGGHVVYTCHMAVIHWALMDCGYSQEKANDIVGQFARSTCQACEGTDELHVSLDAAVYGKLFCSQARQIPTKNDLYDYVDVGDILITGNKHWPVHSMVLRQKTKSDHVTIRGFNNFGTLGTGVFLQYDGISHNITKDKYWTDGPTGRFGLWGADLLVIPHDAFMTQVRGLAKMFA